MTPFLDKQGGKSLKITNPGFFSRLITNWWGRLSNLSWLENAAGSRCRIKKPGLTNHPTYAQISRTNQFTQPESLYFLGHSFRACVYPRLATGAGRRSFFHCRILHNYDRNFHALDYHNRFPGQPQTTRQKDNYHLFRDRFNRFWNFPDRIRTGYTDRLLNHPTDLTRTKNQVEYVNSII